MSLKLDLVVIPGICDKSQILIKNFQGILAFLWWDISLSTEHESENEEGDESDNEENNPEENFDSEEDFM